jgi:protein-L-isoaspartate(D-aspartate) O-methyltransferase
MERDWGSLRALMVEHQIRRRGIRDSRVLQAFLRVPRHLFVPPEYREEAYEDRAVPIGEQQTISQPYMVALMTEAVALTGTERVLEVGTGSGYQAAILSMLCAEVFTVERRPALAARAGRVLAELGIGNFTLAVGDGAHGYPEAAPFDAIVVTAAARAIPTSLRGQLAEGGRMVIPVGTSGYQDLLLARKSGGMLVTQTIERCVFVPLVSDDESAGSPGH